jgi:hypothetical protein
MEETPPDARGICIGVVVGAVEGRGAPGEKEEEPKDEKPIGDAPGVGDEPGVLSAPSLLELSEDRTELASRNFCSALQRMFCTCVRSSSRIEDTCASLSDSTRTTFLMCSTCDDSTGLSPVEERLMTATRRRMHSLTSSSAEPIGAIGSMIVHTHPHTHTTHTPGLVVGCARRVLGT